MKGRTNTMEGKFLIMGLSSSLAQDFAWVVSCAQENASCGYTIRELFASNTTVRDLMRISSKKMEEMISIAGRIGRLLCAEEAEDVDRALDDFRAEAIRQGYITS